MSNAMLSTPTAGNLPETVQKPRLLTTDQAAVYLGLSRRMVQLLTAQKRLACVRIASAVRFNVSDLEDFISRNTVQAQGWKGGRK